MIELFNIDCMEYMKGCEDNSFDLAIVDPPYGIGAGKSGFSTIDNNAFSVDPQNGALWSSDGYFFDGVCFHDHSWLELLRGTLRGVSVWPQSDHPVPCHVVRRHSRRRLCQRPELQREYPSPLSLTLQPSL